MSLSRCTAVLLALFSSYLHADNACDKTAGDPVSSAACHADSIPQTKYIDRGNGLDGFDCSGFTKYVYGRFGIDLSRNTSGQSIEGTDVLVELKPGDLILFDATPLPSGYPTHVGIYEGNNKFIHANSQKYGVERQDLDARGAEGHFWNGVSWRERIFAKRRLPVPPGPSVDFGVGDSVTVTKEASVRTDPLGLDNVLLYTPLVTQSPPAKGVIDYPPVLSNGYWRWRVNFESGADGWVAEDFLNGGADPGYAECGLAAGTCSELLTATSPGLCANGTLWGGPWLVGVGGEIWEWSCKTPYTTDVMACFAGKPSDRAQGQCGSLTRDGMCSSTLTEPSCDVGFGTSFIKTASGWSWSCVNHPIMSCTDTAVACSEDRCE